MSALDAHFSAVKMLIVLLEDTHDIESGRKSYKIAVPLRIQDMIGQLYPSPDGTWRKTFTHEIVVSGSRVVKAGDLDGPFQNAVWFWQGQQFRRAASVEVLKDDLYPETRYAKSALTPLLPNGQGPYCTFIVSELPAASGVYVFFVDGTLCYVGRARSLKKRFYQYGHISPKNCYLNGRSTNIRLNKRVREAFRAGYEIEIFYHVTPGYGALESRMIEALQPPWNMQGIKPSAASRRSGKSAIA